MRRLSRFTSAYRLQHATPHERQRDELGVIADRYAPSPATVMLGALAPNHSERPVDRTLVSR